MRIKVEMKIFANKNLYKNILLNFLLIFAVSI